MTIPSLNNELKFDNKGNLLYGGKKVLYKKVRDRHHQPVGVVVAIDKNKIGFSKCHSKLDNFQRSYGLAVAIRRAEKGVDYIDKTKEVPVKESLENKPSTTAYKKECVIPYDLRSDYEKIKDRAAAYFKD